MIDAAAAYIDETYGKLDILVNNAGVSLREARVPPSQLDVDVLRATWTAVNAITVFFANELRATNIKVNSVSPGYVSTDLNDHSGMITPDQGAQVVVRYATLPADGLTGGFLEEGGVIPW
jgi:NAD(P)-dependent dehydrogenase (short-subunit alcohol dehydrogenase family)